ncbi:MAG: 1-deoxy-D-xylulose-5-phosphate reductoisomerase [Desulfomonilaceae bacterium]
MKRLSILGSSGSIGIQTLDVVRHNPGGLRVVALAGGSNVTLLESQVREFGPELVSVSNEKDFKLLRGQLRDYTRPLKIYFGTEGLEAASKVESADVVVGALPGSVGLKPAFWAVAAKKDLALATKEVLVLAGWLFMEAVQTSKMALTPVDSEQSAIFQCLQGNKNHEVRRILLTASGGPFLRKSTQEIASVTKNETLRHPRWKMGPKVTVDSATLMNKGLEVIETRWLFDVDANRIEVVIHPQSLVHSMVEFVDGSILAQVGATDMKIPISYALGFPNRMSSGTEPLDFSNISPLNFEKPDTSKFPLLAAAYDALNQNETVSPVILNAADEVAVDLFLKGSVPFHQISTICLDAMETIPGRNLSSLDDVEQFHNEVARTVRSKWQGST